ncbi:MAG TPA: MBL fold metallo-hydrolase [Chthoniobacterales bacterium]
MTIPLEDLFEDIVGKAQRGLGLDDEALAEQAEISKAALQALKAGRGVAGQVPAVARVLQLDPVALQETYARAWKPAAQALNGLAQFNTELLGMTVNAYVAWDPSAREAVVFDTGVDASVLLRFVEAQHLQVRRILLTHTHQDHVAVLDELVQATHAPVGCPADEPLPKAEPVHEGVRFTVGGLTIRALLTNGHSAGGTTYVVEGLDAPVAIVGDSLFAGSMGGAPNRYALARRNNREKILTLPDNTVLAPGHGPLTTVAEEKVHNPFLAGS